MHGPDRPPRLDKDRRGLLAHLPARRLRRKEASTRLRRSAGKWGHGHGAEHGLEQGQQAREAVEQRGAARRHLRLRKGQKQEKGVSRRDVKVGSRACSMSQWHAMAACFHPWRHLFFAGRNLSHVVGGLPAGPQRVRGWQRCRPCPFLPLNGLWPDRHAGHSGHPPVPVKIYHKRPYIRFGVRPTSKRTGASVESASLINEQRHV